MTDLKFALRQLLKNPGFTAVAVFTLALGIGANTAIFSIINALLLRPIHAREPEQLVSLYHPAKDSAYRFRSFSYPNYADIRADPKVFEDVLAFARGRVAVNEGDLTRQVSAAFVSANFFSVLGVAPLHGRGFLSEEETSPAAVVVMSYAYWLRSGGDPAMVGKPVVLNNTTFTVVGVMPEGFTGARPTVAPGFFLPLGMLDSLGAPPGGPKASTLTDRAAEPLDLVGRLKPEFSIASINGPLSVWSSQLAESYPTENGGRELVATRIPRFGEGKAQPLPLAVLTQGLSSILLLIVCLNLANLMLARGAARRKEIAVRLAIGAGRRRIIRQLLTEGFLLALLGGAGGVLLAVWVTSTLAASFAPMLSREFLNFDPAPDTRVLAAGIGFCALATILFALGPAWRLARLDLNAGLKEHAAADSRATHIGLLAPRTLLAIGQVALSLALLVAGGLFVRSAAKAVEANPGFEFGSNFYAQLYASTMRWEEPRVRDLYRRAVEQIRVLPGVESVSFGLTMPFGEGTHSISIPHPASLSPESDEPGSVMIGCNGVGVDYFRTLGVPLLRGRDFTRAEVESTNAPRVAIVSQVFADLFWPGEDPVGKRLQFTPFPTDSSDVSMEVVGVVPHLKQDLMENRRNPFLYLPYGQAYQPDILLHVRLTAGTDSAFLMRQTRDALRRLEPLLPVTALKTLRASHETGGKMGALRVGAWLFGAFGLVALLLAAIGIYGVNAYSVARRTREIGIRMALGASAGNVLRMVLFEGARLTAIGLGFGLLLSAAVERLASGFLYGVVSLDLVAFTIAPALLALSALFACWLPAHRAARVDPMEALRTE